MAPFWKRFNMSKGPNSPTIAQLACGKNGSLALLFAMVALNLLDRQIINVLAQDIKADLRISDAQLGLLTGTAFGLFYSVLGIPMGWLADRIDRIKLIGAAIVLWSGFTALSGLAGNFLQLFLCRVGVGVGEAGTTPAGTTLIHDIFRDGRRTSAMSIMMVGAPVGSFLGLLVGGKVGSIWGWRTAFMVAAVPGLILAAAIWAMMRDPKSSMPNPESRVEPQSVLVTLPLLARQPGFLWFLIGSTCAVFLMYASGAWLPAFFIRVHGMNTAEIGAYAAVSVGLGGGLGTLGAGLLCDRLRPYSRALESKVLITALALSVPTLLVTVLSPSRTTALAAMFLFNICAFAFLGPTARITQRVATPGTGAFSFALTISITNIVSLTVGLPAVGVISDILAPRFGVESLRYALALFAAFGVVGTFAQSRAAFLLPDVQRSSVS
jgi:predicted MFS family arabinose efflux permease